MSAHIYVTPAGREVEIPPELAARTKFTKAGIPDNRSKANDEFRAWADEQDKGDTPEPVGEVTHNGDTEYAPRQDLTAEVKSGIGHEDFDRKPFASAGPAQAYALRVWAGQSVSLGYGTRVARIKAALEGQGMSMDGVILPKPEGADDWDDEDMKPVSWRKPA